MARWHVLAVAALALLLGVASLAGGPVGLSYVTSDSMAPTLETGDAYVLVPTDDVDSGDIVTYYSPSKAEYVTHRVVGVTADGYVTKGDNNPSTDQAAGHPVVTADRVVGVVPTVAGHPLVVPLLGSLIRLVQSHTLGLVFGTLALVVLVDRLTRARSRRPARDVFRVRNLVVPLLAVTLVSAVAYVLLTATHVSLPYSVAADGGETAQTLVTGEPATRTHVVRVTRSTLTTPFIDVDGARITDVAVRKRASLGAAGTVVTRAVTVAIPPQTGGTHTVDVHVYGYPSTLPESVLAWLHALHPGVAAVASVTALFSPALAVYALLADGRRPLRAPRHRSFRRFLGGDDQ